MCGIAGVSLARGVVADRPMLAVMGEALAHRGPDGEGMALFQNMGLVHRRLAIVDVEGGRQPFVEKVGKTPVALVANGEIYNHAQLRVKLEGEGVVLATHSDCEPPLHGVMRHGVGYLDKLEGMYGLALMDGRVGELVLARDPFGIKPLYYMEHEKGFAFASEPRALLALGWVAPAMDMRCLPHLLGEHFVEGDGTPFVGIQRVLPGERLVVKDGKVVARRRKALPLLARRGETSGPFGQELEEAVRRHMAPEVKMGLFLSGGIDSGALLVALARDKVPCKAYTICFSEDGEALPSAAAAMAARAGMGHVDVPYTRADFWQDMVEAAWALDDAVADYAMLPSLKLARTARADGVKVVFSGEGGDEMMAGYRRFWEAPWKKALRKLPLRQGGARKLAPYVRAAYMKGLGRAHGVKGVDAKGLSALQRAQLANVAGSMPGDLFAKLDRCLMAHGLEGRVPYLDDRFAAYAFGLPDGEKVREGFGKWCLRSYLADHGEADMAWRPKQGFSVPVGPWLAADREKVEAVCAASPLLREILKPKALEALLGRLPDRKVVEPVFTLLFLAMWHALHVEGLGVETLRARVGA